MSVIWPISIPQQVLMGDYRAPLPDNTIRFQTSVGPAKVRRRGTSAPRTHSCSYQMTTAEKSLFEEFYITTTVGGTVQFEWPGPEGDESIDARFASPPTIMCNGPDDWKITAQIEEMP